MKKTFILILIGMIVFSLAAKDSMAAKKAKKSASSISQEDMNAMAETIDSLTKKVYSNSLFSPADNASMIEIKIKLDNQMLVAPDLSLAPLYYKAANLYKSREYKREAIDCYQTILENFPDTALAPKAKQALQAMGVNIIDPNNPDGNTTGQAAEMEQSQEQAEQPQQEQPAQENSSQPQEASKTTNE